MDNSGNMMDRRSFLKTGAQAAMAAAAIGMVAKPAKAVSEVKANKKLKLAMVGTGDRGSTMWGKSVIEPYGEYVEFVGLCDINPLRAEFVKKYMGVDAATYVAKDFEKMIKETKPDKVIITTPDCFHVDYLVRAMELGCDVICEKPIATQAEQCQRLLEAERKTGKKITVTFNMRHANSSEELKKVMMSGDLGRIISANYHEYLNVSHGASYFRRWHGKKKFSGSLLCHKATHQFDQMNWWLDAEPMEVNAFGKVAFYGKNNSFRSRKCRGCPFKDKCQFFWDITKEKRYMGLYVACEKVDGYLRDGCVWSNDIDTYDTATVEVKYNNGVIMNYSMDAYLPYEGQWVSINGTKGKLDVRFYGGQPWDVDCEAEFRFTESFGKTKTWKIETSEGGHGGADEKMKNIMFKPDQADPLGGMAGSRAGVMSAIIGIAARKSIETGERQKVSDLVKFPMEWHW